MAIRARTFTYAVSLDRAGTATSEDGGTALAADKAWSPEHLVLAGLVRCSLTSLEYHAKADGIEVEATAEATASVTKCEEDGRYAFVEIAIAADLTLAPAPENVREFLARAERDCFVGASLTTKPHYSWTVNGEEIR